jgi:hypothetical protein
MVDPPGESAGLIQCRDPKKIPDPAKPVALVAAGDSVTSAHNQTGFGIGKCDNTAADARGLKGDDANFSYAGKYFDINKQITAYYNFARTGFTTDAIRNASVKNKTTDACGNDWGRNDTPLNLAVNAVKAAKAAKSAAYVVATGGVNNTNWTTVVAQLAECQGMEFAANTLLAGVPGITVNSYYIVSRLKPTDPPQPKKNLITNGGALHHCHHRRAAVVVPRGGRRVQRPRLAESRRAVQADRAGRHRDRQRGTRKRRGQGRVDALLRHQPGQPRRRQRRPGGGQGQDARVGVEVPARDSQAVHRLAHRSALRPPGAHTRHRPEHHDQRCHRG